MRVIVTGGSGFIGTNLVERFIARGDEVINLDVASPRHAGHVSCWRHVDILDKDGLARAIGDFRPDVVVHMAARTDLAGTSVVDYRVNTDGVSNMVAVLRRLPGLRIAVFASSMLVCRIGYRPSAEDDYMPSTAYGSSKVEGEVRVRQEAGDGFPWIMLRPTSIWGPWFGSPYRDFFNAVRRGVYVHPAGYRVRRSYGFVLNSVHQIERIVEANGADLLGRTAYLADYEPIELSTWAHLIQEHLGVRPVREVPLIVFQAAAQLGDALKAIRIHGFPINSFRLNNMLTECLLDTGPIEAAVGPLPYDVRRAVALTCEWMRSYDADRS